MAIDTAPCQVRPAAKEDMSFMLQMAAQEGWNPGVGDAEPFFSADPEGFFVAEVEGKPVGSISGVAYGKSFGFLGLYIVERSLRQRGIGHALWQAAVDHLQGRLIGGDAVTAQYATYRSLGYRIYYRTIRYQTISQRKAALPGVMPLADIPFPQFAAYDRACFPEEREAFLRSWIAMPKSCGAAVMEGDSLKGYGIIRASFQGYRIGPLFADDAEIATAIFNALLSFPEEGLPVFIDIPEPNNNALTLIQQVSMTPVFETGRMYNGSPPPLPLNRIYGVTSLELG